jgi:hypothetical protein
MTSVFPRAMTPLASSALPVTTRPAPTMSRANCMPGEFISGASRRLISRANALARTGDPSLNLNPLRSLKVYVLPSRETVGRLSATSG